jgi:hypothetical protein
LYSNTYWGIQMPLTIVVQSCHITSFRFTSWRTQLVTTDVISIW